MKTTEKTTTLESGLTIKVVREYGYMQKTINADGDIVNLGSEFRDFISIYLTKGDVKEFLRDLNFLYVLDTTKACWQDAIKKGAYARFSDICISKATYDAIMELIDQSKNEAEEIEKPSDLIKVIKQDDDYVVNPLYAHMTKKELKEAEINYDNLQNEGTTEGYNPYRDNLFVKK